MKFANLVTRSGNTYSFLNQPITEVTAEKINEIISGSMDFASTRKCINRIYELLEGDELVNAALSSKREELKEIYQELSSYDEDRLNVYLANCPLNLTYTFDEALTKTVSGYRFEIKDNTFLYLPKKVEIDAKTKYPNLGSIVYNDGVVMNKMKLDAEFRNRIMNACSYQNDPVSELLREDVSSMI